MADLLVFYCHMTNYHKLRGFKNNIHLLSNSFSRPKVQVQHSPGSEIKVSLGCVLIWNWVLSSKYSHVIGIIQFLLKLKCLFSKQQGIGVILISKRPLAGLGPSKHGSLLVQGQQKNVQISSFRENQFLLKAHLIRPYLLTKISLLVNSKSANLGPLHVQIFSLLSFNIT